MIAMPRMLLASALLGTLALFGTLGLATPAGAQSSDSDVSFDAGALLPKKPKPGLPDVKAQPLAWPRLDPGAVLCRTEADLEKLAARRSGEVVSGSIDCQIIRAATAISIVQRKGPGKAEVKISDAKADGTSGWTDAWLPDKAPVSARR
jgi:hypothetical protein